MIAQLTGVLAHEAPDQLVVDVQGVGYLVHVPAGTSARLPRDEEGRVRVVIQTNVREDAIQLFGFASDDEKWVFNKLTSVSGIGPKLGLSILSDLSADVSFVRYNKMTCRGSLRSRALGKRPARGSFWS